MKCIYCGTELKDGSLFCYHCGKEARMVPDFNVLEDEYLKAILDEEGNEGQEAGSAELSALAKEQEEQRMLQQKEEAAKREKKKRILIISSVSAVVAILVIIVVAFLIRNSIDKENAASYDYQVQCAREAENEGDIQAAIDYYEAALALKPEDVEVRLVLGAIYMERKDYNSALVCYREVLQRDANNREACQNLIQIYEKDGDTEAILKLAAEITDTKLADLFAAYEVTPPVFSQEEGVLEEFVELKLSTSGDYDIFYTMDGSDPIQSGSRYKKPIVLDEMGEYVIKAVCVNDKKVYSEVVTAKYTIELPPPKAPVVTPDGGVFDQETTVTIEVPYGCTAYYIWSDTEETPNITSEKYTQPISVPKGNNILSVVVIDDETELISDVYRGNFVYNDALEDPDEISGSGTAEEQ